MFITFTLASKRLAYLRDLQSALSTEWLLAIGLLAMIPQFVELVVEYGITRGLREMVGGFFSSTLFFIFQNKTIAEAMKLGGQSGFARYLFTGRPQANQHQMWRQHYLTYWRSHYNPAMQLFLLYMVYIVLVWDSGAGGLPMVLVIITFIVWMIAPLVFSVFPRWSVIRQDAHDFKSFVFGKAAMEVKDIPFVLARSQQGKARSLYEVGLGDMICVWCDYPTVALWADFLCRVLVTAYLLLILPTGIVDFGSQYVIFLGFQWLLLLLFFATDLNNVILMLGAAVWILVPMLGQWVLGDRAVKPNVWLRAPEYLISFLLFLYAIGTVKRAVLLAARLVYCSRVRRGWKEADARSKLQLSIRFCYFFFFDHQLRVVRASVVLLLNTVVAVILMLLDSDCLGIRLHTLWLLNGQAARGLTVGKVRNTSSWLRPSSWRGSTNSSPSSTMLATEPLTKSSQSWQPGTRAIPEQSLQPRPSRGRADSGRAQQHDREAAATAGPGPSRLFTSTR
mmetsp:Transcript_39687/g.89028  ORF Transcript_39687/g.89028 Transcript_39687/m.89028 type:complete len:507 (+) Transcript_39687:3142-4662(+)